jgi:acyltransferase-like protein
LVQDRFALIAGPKLERCHVTSRVNVPLGNVRAVVILIVVAFHSALPYLASQPAAPYPFDAAPYRWVAFPIIDHERWFGFDLFCAFQDISLMSLMFFLAGLFTPASLERKGSLAYWSQRWWRIGMPFLFAAGLLSPLAYFASYRETAANPSLTAFWQQWLALPMWPAGPAWFLWQVFLLGTLAAAMHALAPQWLAALSRQAGRFDERPFAFFVTLTALSTLAYVPLAMVFSAWDWTNLGPFGIQLSRPLHYVIYFFAGFAVGHRGCDRGILRSDGPLARYWLAFLAAALTGFCVWGGLTFLTMPDWGTSPRLYRLAAALAFPPACASGMLSLLAICLRWLKARDRLLDSLSANAYRIYLVHYVFVVWLQYALLGLTLGAIGKGIIVFAGALGASWAVGAAVSALLPHSEVPGEGAVVGQPR